MQVQGRTEKPKINRLRRSKRILKSDLMLPECDVIGPDVTHDQTTSGRLPPPPPPPPHGVQCSPPNQSLLLNREAEVKSGSDTPPPLHHHHHHPSEARGLMRSERDLNAAACRSDLTSHRARFTSSAECFADARARDEFLRQVRAQNPRFPVRRLFRTLLKRRDEGKSGSAAGKRKQEVECWGDGRLCKRQRQNGSDWGVSRRNTLRTEQVCVQSAAVEETLQDEGRDEDEPWTEKYRPRSCDDVIGNSAAVRKLYSWLKEWRIRADVEERRKRREERRMKKESNGSWDCGDFEGDPLTDECEADLCNTLLIHGPTGAGKTAAVFACAEQLGFKVLEVNCSSLRSGRLVLSQLRESTQSHQVGAPQVQTPPAGASRSEAPVNSVSSCKNPPAIRRAAHREKRRGAQTPATLTRYFRKTGNAEPPHNTRGGSCEADEVTREDRKEKPPPMSLVLFEEVDIVFEEDVGFLAAVKSLMSDTKRPIVMTTNDASFGETFSARHEEIRFRTPAAESVVSYLQCVCAVHNVKTDPDHVRFTLQENGGDVRRSVLALELWARSGAGNTHYHLQHRALSCRSYTELESSGCVQALVESWRKGRSLLYSNLDLILAPPAPEKAHQSTFDQNGTWTTGRLEAPPPSSAIRRSRLRLKKRDSELDGSRRTHGSAARSQLDALARLCDAVSFVDSYVSPRPPRKSGARGAKMADGVLDEPREERGDDDARMERCYEVMAAVEGLGLRGCGTGAWPGDQDARRGDTDRTWKLSEDGAAVVRRALRSKAFRYHGDQTAVLTDYLPCLRFICRQQRDERQTNLRAPDYLRDIGLRLPESVLDSLASQLR